jgi:hypothetical protein
VLCRPVQGTTRKRQCASPLPCQVLQSELPKFYKSSYIGGTDARCCNDLTLNLFGYIELASPTGESIGRLYATQHWRGKNPELGKFSTLRIRRGSQGEDVEFAQLLLLFAVVFPDDVPRVPQQLALVQTFGAKKTSNTVSTVAISETLLTRPKCGLGCSIIPLSRIVDYWHIVRDVNFPGDEARFLANEFVFAAGLESVTEL